MLEFGEIEATIGQPALDNEFILKFQGVNDFLGGSFTINRHHVFIQETDLPLPTMEQIDFSRSSLQTSVVEGMSIDDMTVRFVENDDYDVMQFIDKWFKSMFNFDDETLNPPSGPNGYWRDGELSLVSSRSENRSLSPGNSEVTINLERIYPISSADLSFAYGDSDFVMVEADFNVDKVQYQFN